LLTTCWGITWAGINQRLQEKQCISDCGGKIIGNTGVDLCRMSCLKLSLSKPSCPQQSCPYAGMLNARNEIVQPLSPIPRFHRTRPTTPCERCLKAEPPSTSPTRPWRIKGGMPFMANFVERLRRSRECQRALRRAIPSVPRAAGRNIKGAAGEKADRVKRGSPSLALSVLEISDSVLITLDNGRLRRNNLSLFSLSCTFQ
jgi:hypothetical protein